LVLNQLIIPFGFLKKPAGIASGVSVPLSLFTTFHTKAMLFVFCAVMFVSIAIAVPKLKKIVYQIPEMTILPPEMTILPLRF
jgi:hypothetical protein